MKSCFSGFLYVVFVMAASLSLTQNVLADNAQIYCYGVVNSPAGMSSSIVKGVYAGNPSNGIFSGWPNVWYMPNVTNVIEGTWANKTSTGWMQYFRLSQNVTLAQVKQACVDAFKKQNYAWYTENKVTIYPMALGEDPEVQFQYPIVENNSPLYYLSDSNGSPMTHNNSDSLSSTISFNSNFLNYRQIYNLVSISDNAYCVEYYSKGTNGAGCRVVNSATTLNEAIPFPYPFINSNSGDVYANPDGFKPIEIMVANPDDSLPACGGLGSVSGFTFTSPCSHNGSYGIAYKSDVLKEIVVAFKGTNPKDSDDLVADAEIVAGNQRPNSALGNYIYNAWQFYTNIKIQYPESSGYTVILTSHSLGAFVASQVAMRTGELARVFSAPSNYVLVGSNPYAYLPMPNVINFARSLDPIVDLSKIGEQLLVTQPVNTTIGFPADALSDQTLDFKFVDNHSLMQFIPSIFENFYNTYVGEYGYTSNYKNNYTGEFLTNYIPQDSIYLDVNNAFTTLYSVATNSPVAKSTFSYVNFYPGTVFGSSSNVVNNDVILTDSQGKNMNINFVGYFDNEGNPAYYSGW